MGVLRVYLALCVIADHAGPVLPWQMHDGRQAVQIFYIISGFYMAMVLSSRYAKPGDFYLSRFMRIFPPYWVVLAATLVLSWASGLFFDRWLLLRTYINHPFQHNGALGVLLAAASNVTLMGQDWVMFLRHDYGHPLQLTGNFWNDPSPLWRFLLIPQSWSIGVELTFYACAPYLNRLRSRWLVCIAVVALAARLIGYGCLGLAHDPWSYRFFPFEIALFVFGMLGYRLYALTEPRHPTRRWRCDSNLSYLAGAAVLLLVLYLDSGVEHRLSLVVGPELAVLVKYPFLIIGIPVLFFATGKNKIDRLIGELSYPIYLVHYLILVLVANILSYLGIGKGLGVIGAIGSIIVAALFYRFFIARLDSKRHLLTVKAPDSGDTAAQERNVAAG